MKPLLGSTYMTPVPYIVGPMPEGHQGTAACGIYLIPKELMKPLGNSPTHACHHSTPTAHACAMKHEVVPRNMRMQLIHDLRIAEPFTGQIATTVYNLHVIMLVHTGRGKV